MKSAWPEMLIKGMTPAARRKMNLKMIQQERNRKANRAECAEILAQARNPKAQGEAAAEARKQLLKTHPGKSVRILWNKAGTMQAKVGGRFVKL